MVAFSQLVVVALSTIASTLASPVDVLDTANFSLNPAALLNRRQSDNYNQDYTTGGSVNFSPSSTGFTLNWNTESGFNDLVVGKGWQPGNDGPVTYSGSFDVTGTGGTSILALYGWTENPLVEYYVVEDSVNLPSQGTFKGTLVSDGATYNIYENTRTNEPSILGTSTFNQYISVRQIPRTSGTITFANHASAWASHGMSLGTYNFQVIAVEAYNAGSSGTASYTVSKSSGGSSPPSSSSVPPATTSKPPATSTSTPIQSTMPTSTPGTCPASTVTSTSVVYVTTTVGGTTSPSTTTSETTSPTGGTCALLYGQCAGDYYTGPTCCQSGTCQFQSQYYSQCLM